ncbi:MAG: DUF3047 domain-containing protein [Betaproteobacteria bacterium]|nr:DUF3047 domain-containing protein [Betaproteobacteria bacterium]
MKLQLRTAVMVLGLVAAIPTFAKDVLLVADPAAPLARAWTHQRFGAATEYKEIMLDGVAAIRAIGRNSASGLYRDFRYRIAEHPWIEWTWRVDRLQRTADIRVKAREDYAAVLFLIFGRPSLLNRDVPTLAYVWTSARIPEGSILDSPYHPGTTRNIVVRSGEARLGEWLTERRNVIDDFRRAFGRESPETVEVIALFTDNDQTREPVETYYGAVQALPR